MSGFLTFIEFIWGIILIIAYWKIFEKAGYPGWASLIPIYNTYIMLKMVLKPGWWLLLLFIPIVNIIIVFIVALETAKVFGKSSAFGIGLFFLSFIFYPILAFSDAEYLPNSKEE